MYRKIEAYLKQWKLSANRKPMLLRGARQVGKTFIIDKFGSENYDYYLKINLEQDTNLHHVFENSKPSLHSHKISPLQF